MIFRKLFTWAILSNLLAFAGAAEADVFQMGGVRDTATGTWTGLASVEFVPVGDAGNAKDPDTGYGEVDYAYNIGKYDVTAGQYCEFLNAVAKKSDPYGLYNINMDATQGNMGCNIKRNGTAGNYNYTVTTSWANRPVNFVSWGDAARFCNWLQNGQKTGNEDASTTEDGAYTLLGANTDPLLMGVIRNPNSQYFIPSIDEWYKAAYFDSNKNGSGQPGYWLYPTKHDTPPINKLDATGTNNANFYDDAGTGTGGYTVGGAYYRTPVGAFAESPSTYGTFDQGGNVGQWTETAKTNLSRSIKSGDYLSEFGALSKWVWTGNYPTFESSGGGFRITAAIIPEPSMLTMLLLSSVLGFSWRRWVRK